MSREFALPSGCSSVPASRRKGAFRVMRQGSWSVWCLEGSDSFGLPWKHLSALRTWKALWTRLSVCWLFKCCKQGTNTVCRRLCVRVVQAAGKQPSQADGIIVFDIEMTPVLFILHLILTAFSLTHASYSCCRKAHAISEIYPTSGFARFGG